MLAASPSEDPEEWAIHDSENWMGVQISETEDIEYLAELAELLEEHGKAYAIFLQYDCNKPSPAQFTEAYCGVYESEEDFMQESWEESGKLRDLEKAGLPSYYIDWEIVARDAFINDYFSVQVSYNEVYVFNRDY